VAIVVRVVTTVAPALRVAIVVRVVTTVAPALRVAIVVLAVTTVAPAPSSSPSWQRQQRWLPRLLPSPRPLLLLLL
jgi:hypothetical protein